MRFSGKHVLIKADISGYIFPDVINPEANPAVSSS